MSTPAPPPGSPTGPYAAGPSAAGSPQLPPGAPRPDPQRPPDRPRRRDRRGRGLRGPMLPADVPAARTRADVFDDHVLEVVERLEARFGSLLDGAEFAVEDVPPSDPAPWEDGSVPLGRYFPAESGQPSRVVVYRRPVEARAYDADDLADLVRDVVVEQVAHLLGRAPEDVDPRYGRD